VPFERPDWLPTKDTAPATETEAAVLRFWKENRVFEKSLEASEGRPPFVFYEGPPTANGRPHPGHVLTRVVKDLFPRYRTMTGFHVPRKAGWDTHGLPVEIEVEKELGLRSKEDIEKYGVESFVRKCMESVFRYTRDWEELTDRIGFWIDLSEAYVTYTREYVESVWWALAELWKKERLYRGHKIVPWCPRCGTALSSHEVGWGYRTVDDPSITVKFRVTKMPDGSAPAEPTYLLAWTTTPWTLLSNAALAVKPDATYVWVKEGGDTYILGRDRAEAVLGPSEPPHHERASAGSALEGMEYEPLFPLPTEERLKVIGEKRAHYVVTGEFVTLTEGTGVVHIAPAFGADDYEVGKKRGLPMICRVDARGHMTPDTGPFAGRFAKDVDADIFANLKQRELLVPGSRLKGPPHDYPFCWRCESPLLYYPRAGWFIRTTAFRDRMLELNRRIAWYPGHIREGRFGNFLKDNVDWALSRERYWGTPLPIWRCRSCGYTEAVASYEELAAKDEVEGLDAFDEAKRKDPSLDENLRVHKPYIDAVRYACPVCSSRAERVPEVIDCWFDSGAMPFAQWGYPGAGREAFEAAFPADFISEAIDQTRGWFYSLLAISALLFDREPYRTCIVLGHVCDEKGFKMSKSKGNYVEPGEILDSQGADALRWYFLSANQPWTSVRFSQRAVQMAAKDFLVKLRNCFSFFKIYARIDGFDPADGGGPVTDARPSSWGDRAGRRPVAERAPLDRWILGELAATVAAVRDSMDRYDPYAASQALSAFVESLSNWYLRRSRSRFWGPGKGAGMSEDKLDAYWTLYEALVSTTLLVAPFTPFAAEELYQVLVRSAWPGSAPESVHLCEYPAVDDFPREGELARAMSLAREASALGRAARAQAKIKVRTPLSEATVVAPDAGDARLLAGLVDVVADELNVKQVAVASHDPPEVRFQVRPNFRVLGPRLGSKVKDVTAALATVDGATVRREMAISGEYALRVGKDRRTGKAIAFRGEDLPASPTTPIECYKLAPGDLDVRAEAAEGYSATSGQRLVVLLDARIDERLRNEGRRRELVSLIQAVRKEMELPYESRISVRGTAPSQLVQAFKEDEDYIRNETLATQLVFAPGGPRDLAAGPTDTVKCFRMDDGDVTVAVKRQGQDDAAGNCGDTTAGR
jgi:isoleucyl-tRNA synthetase